MGEPTCLMRSFSHPSSASREFKEGDPLRALTESISFGRFMSESLAWEKWSTFSHNRYLEEVEQFSKPGSVAQKKAFFEAHYKKRAAFKAAALLEQPNNTVNSSIPEEEMAVSNVLETETCIPEEDMAVSNVLETETTVNTSIPEEDMAVNNVLETETTVSSIPEEEITVDSVLETETTVSSIPEEDMAVSNVLETETTVDSSFPEEDMTVSNVPETETIVNSSIPEEEITVGSVLETENMDITCREVEHLKPLDKAENFDKIPEKSEEKMPKKEMAEKENMAVQKNNVALPVNKRPMNSLSKPSSQNRASKIPKSLTKTGISTQMNGGTILKPKSKSSVGDSINNTKLTTKSVHMSINLACQSGLTSKSSIRMSKQCLNKIEARSPTISSPFCFRSEERAAKRKEFFKKLEEEKNNQKTHTTQVKSKVPFRKIRKLSSSVAVETVSQLHRRPSVSAESSKPTIPKSNQSTTPSVYRLPRRKANENSSPNIQL